jgi:AcrR family transcriptional regulator
VSGLAERDRRAERHQATRDEILDAAWEMVREQGLAALSLRELGARVGMRAQSLYVYFPSKHAIYDAMFADGNRKLLELRRDLPDTGDPVDALARSSHVFVEFCTSDPVRYQLLFQRTIPGFEPSTESYAIARENLDLTRQRLAAVGVTKQSDLDLYTALFGGLISQQLANQPGGDRWTQQFDRVFDMFLREVTDRTRASKNTTTTHGKPARRR